MEFLFLLAGIQPRRDWSCFLAVMAGPLLVGSLVGFVSAAMENDPACLALGYGTAAVAVGALGLAWAFNQHRSWMRM